jgi:formate hydrogenlyase subunit 3/multisubunit Na+/H+ antiporter MnhD subunit
MGLPTLTGTVTCFYIILSAIYNDDYETIVPITVVYIVLAVIFIVVGLVKYSAPNKQR